MEEVKQDVVAMPRIGDKAPEFTAKTTQGDINYPSDYKGSWTLLFSHFNL
jgi:peroxiredoxin (alkyl hydroperoxide reductase subunit C)